MAEIRAIISADAAKFNTSLKEARAEAEKFKGSVSTVGEKAEAMKTIFMGAVGIAASVGLAIKSTVGAADEISDTAERFGVTTDEVQRLGIAAEATGTSAESLFRGISKLRIKMSELAAGNKEAVDAFKAVGITQKDAASGAVSTMDAFGKVSEAVKVCATDVEKLTVISGVFGDKLANELVPILSKSAGDLEAFSSGVVIASDAAVTKVARLQDTFNSLATSIKGASIEMLAFAMDAMNFSGRDLSQQADSPERTAEIAKFEEFKKRLSKERAEKATADAAAKKQAEKDAKDLAETEKKEKQWTQDAEWKRDKAISEAKKKTAEDIAKLVWSRLEDEDKILKLIEKEEDLIRSIRKGGPALLLEEKRQEYIKTVMEKEALLKKNDIDKDKTKMGNFKNEADTLQAVGLFAGGKSISYSRTLDENTRKTAENTARIARAVEGKQTTSPTVYAP